MTCVSGHLTKLDFGPEFNDWSYPPPERLFDGPVHLTIDEVCF
jgi:DNA topoisomerase III